VCVCVCVCVVCVLKSIICYLCKSIKIIQFSQELNRNWPSISSLSSCWFASIQHSILNLHVILWQHVMIYITACLGAVTSFLKNILSQKADWIFILFMCLKCNPCVVGIKPDLTYIAYSLNFFTLLLLERVWNKYKVSLCSKGLLQKVLQKVLIRWMFIEALLITMKKLKAT
jgi:hypothetical protein